MIKSKLQLIILIFITFIVSSPSYSYIKPINTIDKYRKKVKNQYKFTEGYMRGDKELTHKYHVMIQSYSIDDTVIMYRRIGEDYYTGRNKKRKRNLKNAYFWFKKGEKLNDAHSKDRIQEIEKIFKKEKAQN